MLVVWNSYNLVASFCTHHLCSRSYMVNDISGVKMFRSTAVVKEAHASAPRKRRRQGKVCSCPLSFSDSFGWSFLLSWFLDFCFMFTGCFYEHHISSLSQGWDLHCHCWSSWQVQKRSLTTFRYYCQCHWRLMLLIIDKWNQNRIFHMVHSIYLVRLTLFPFPWLFSFVPVWWSSGIHAT